MTRRGALSLRASTAIGTAAELEGIYFDKLMPWITYKYDGKDRLSGSAAPWRVARHTRGRAELRAAGQWRRAARRPTAPCPIV